MDEVYRQQVVVRLVSEFPTFSRVALEVAACGLVLLAYGD